jgi:hypothetical protein
MKKFLAALLAISLFTCNVFGAWKYNPFTGKQDYYIGTADDTFVPYTGATQGLDLGANILTVTEIHSGAPSVEDYLYHVPLYIYSGYVSLYSDENIQYSTKYGISYFLNWSAHNIGDPPDGDPTFEYVKFGDQWENPCFSVTTGGLLYFSDVMFYPANNRITIDSHTGIIWCNQSLSFQPNSDIDDYLQLSTTGNAPHLTIVGGSNLYLEADTGTPTLKLYTDGSHLMEFQSWGSLGAYHQYIYATDALWIYSGGDSDDYLTINTTANQTTINFVGQNGKITADSGTIDFDNELLLTTAPPTSPYHLTNKEYVDLAVSSLELSEFFSATASDIGGIYYVMDVAQASASTVVSADVTTTDQNIFNFATLTAYPHLDRLVSGIYDCHAHIQKTITGNKAITVYYKLYKRATDTTETLLGTSETSAELSTTSESITLHLTLASEVALDITDRLVVKWYANLVSGAGNGTVTISVGLTNNSHFSVKVNALDLRNIFIPYNGALNNIDLGNKTITTTGTASVGTLTHTGEKKAYATKSDTYNPVVVTDDVLVLTGTADKTFTLPTAVGIQGQVFTFKNNSTKILTIATTSSQTIDGATTYLIRTTGSGITIISDNANWQIISVF